MLLTVVSRQTQGTNHRWVIRVATTPAWHCANCFTYIIPCHSHSNLQNSYYYPVISIFLIRKVKLVVTLALTL